LPKELDQGLWALFHERDIGAELEAINQRGSLQATTTFGLDDFLGPSGRLSRDSQIGSIGGGNHFVEIQYVKNIIDGTTAIPVLNVASPSFINDLLAIGTNIIAEAIKKLKRTVKIKSSLVPFRAICLANFNSNTPSME